MSAWRPNEQGLKAIMQLLVDSKNGNTQVQRSVNQKLEQFNATVPDFNNYLAFIFSSMKNEDPSLRQIAGLILKTNLRASYEKIDPLSPQILHIKQLLVEALTDSASTIRNTAGNIISGIVFYQGVKKWLNLIQMLLTLLDSKDSNAVDGAMSTLLKICEDDAKSLDADDAGKPAQIIIPKVIKYFAYPLEVVRRDAVAAVLQFIPLMPHALLINMESYLKGLFQLTQDQSKKVRKYVSRSFVWLLDKPQFLQPNINFIFEYILACTNDVADEPFALEACDFWNTLAEHENCKEFFVPLQQFLPKLIPVLLKAMVYSEIDRLVLDEESQRPDKDSDVKPHFHQSKVRSVHDSMVPQQPQQPQSNDDEDDDDDYDEDDQGEFDNTNDWNLRKSAASTLDVLSTLYGNAMLSILLPAIEERLKPQNPWEVRESAILALGAVAEGCRTGMTTFLNNLVPYLITHLDDPKPLVRSITCWTLSRYSKWIVDQKPIEKFFVPLLGGLLNKIVDNNKRVQEAACSAFATIEEQAGTMILPYLKQVLQCLAKAFTMYQKKNLLILYDAIGTVADLVGQYLNNSEFIGIIMPPLLDKWNKLDNADSGLIPLLECLSSIATALRMGFQQFAKPIVGRCAHLIESTYMAENVATQTGGDFPDKEFIICPLDLLAAIVDALGPSVESLVKEFKLVPLLTHCLRDNMGEVRQSAFGLLGDLVKACIGHVRELLPQIIPILINNLNTKPLAAANNACWALGEIAMQIGKDMKPYIDPALQLLIPTMNNKSLNVSLLENAAITIGRLGLVCPDKVGPHLGHFCQNWCLALRNIKNDIEKDHAFRGLCAMIRFNPQGVVSSFAYVCEAIAAYSNAKVELKQEFILLLKGFKNGMGEMQWNNYVSKFSPEVQQVLVHQFKI